MPQNAIIRADGTGDYTSLAAWESAEQSSNYGSVTVGRVDGFFDLGTGFVAIAGTWPNGAKLEAFDSADAFDGTERQLCGVTSSNSTRVFRSRLSVEVFEIDGLEIYGTGNPTAGPVQSDTSQKLKATNCLVHSGVSATKVADSIQAEDSVFVNENTGNAADIFTGNVTFTNCSVFYSSSRPTGDIANITATKTVFVNSGSGDDIDTLEATQTNNASTDTSADTYQNIVLADEFESSTPITSQDYRIKSTGTLAANTVGAFIQSGGGSLEIDPSTISSTSQVFTPTSVFREEVLDVPLLQATPTVYSQEVLPHPSIDATLVDNLGNDTVYQPEVLLSKILDMESVEGSSEVYGLTIEQPITLDIDSRIDALSSVPNIYVLLDGQGIFIPVTDRVTMHKVANYLRGEGFTGNDNDVIVEWLFSEGVEEGTYNDRFNNYLATQGYSIGTLQDRQKEWTKG